MPSASSAPTLPFLERLLDGEKVEWKTLGEVAEIGTGNSNRQDETENGSYPFYVRSKNVLRSSNYQFDETAIIIPGEGGIGDIFHYAEGKYALHQRAYRIKVNTGNELVPKFLFYYMTNAFKPFILARCVGATATSIRKPMLAVFPIPLPPLRVQSRIVEILDKFTQLEAELEAELEARNKQYDFYRNRLLDFAHRDDLAGQVEWKTLGEVAEYVRERIAVDQLCAQTYVGVDNLLPNRAGKKDSNYLPTEGNAIAYQPNDILIGNIRPYLKKIWKADNEGGASADVLVVRITNSLLTPGYLYHLLADDRFFSYDMQHAKGAKMPRGNKEKILDYVLPLPPLSEQRRIVEILDRFDTLTNSISEGLPREIALRRKQYEYYRDALLRFPPPAPTA